MSCPPYLLLTITLDGRAGKSSLCNFCVSETARHSDVSTAWSLAGEKEDLRVHFHRDDDLNLSGSVFARAPSGVNRPSLEYYETWLLSLSDNHASILKRMADAFEAEKVSFAARGIALAKKNIGPLPVLEDNSDPTT